MSIVEVVEKFVKMWYNVFVCERQIGNCGGDRNDDVFTFKKYLNT